MPGPPTTCRSARVQPWLAAVDAEIAILGGGCAGLSLATHLTADRGPRRARVVVLEARRDYTRDRTWCFWPVEPHPFTDAVSHRWARWEVLDQGRRVRRGSPHLPYVQIPADAFYARARERIDAAPAVDLHLGVDVRRVDDRGDHVALDTSGGPLRVAHVFDTRPPLAPAAASAVAEVTLLQHFVGWEVVADRPAFDPEVVTLMDFSVPQRDGLHFVYVLPYAADRALVEATYFTPALLPEATYERALRDYLGDRLGVGAFEVVLRERGVIPMTTAPPALRQSPRVHNLGLRGGAAKASTGYAFLAIQRSAAELARRLAIARPGALIDPPEPRPALAVAMDRVFLSHLERHPERAPALFVDLFERLPPDLLIRFLSDRATPAECLRVMASTPLAAMTREVLRSRARWLRPASRPL